MISRDSEISYGSDRLCGRQRQLGGTNSACRELVQRGVIITVARFVARDVETPDAAR